MAARIRHSSVPAGFRTKRTIPSVARASSVRPTGGRYCTTTPSVARASSVRPTGGRYYTTTVNTVSPTKNFGTRLGSGYNLKIRSRVNYPSTIESCLPPIGRDSWSAYRASGRALDLDDEIVYRSKRRDDDIYQGIHELPPVVSPATSAHVHQRLDNLTRLARYGGQPVRASSIPPTIGHQPRPESRRVKGVIVLYDDSIQSSQDLLASRGAAIYPSKLRSSGAIIARAHARARQERAASVPPIHITQPRAVKNLATIRPVAVQGFTPTPMKKNPVTAKRIKNTVKVNDYAVPRARTEILLPYVKTDGHSVIDISSPSSALTLRMRLAEAQRLSDLHGAALDRCLAASAEPGVAIEVRRIRQDRLSRSQAHLPPVHIPKRFRSRFLKN